MMTGNTHPRLSYDDVLNLVVPVPNLELQRSMVDELAKRRSRARRLRTEARKSLTEAEETFAAALLGNEPVKNQASSSRQDGAS